MCCYVELSNDVRLVEYTHTDDDDLRTVIENCAELVQPVLKVIPNVLVTIGSYGVLMCRSTTPDTPFHTAGSLIAVRIDM